MDVEFGADCGGDEEGSTQDRPRDGPDDESEAAELVGRDEADDAQSRDEDGDDDAEHYRESNELHDATLAGERRGPIRRRMTLRLWKHSSSGGPPGAPCGPRLRAL